MTLAVATRRATGGATVSMTSARATSLTWGSTARKRSGATTGTTTPWPGATRAAPPQASPRSTAARLPSPNPNPNPNPKPSPSPITLTRSTAARLPNPNPNPNPSPNPNLKPSPSPITLTRSTAARLPNPNPNPNPKPSPSPNPNQVNGCAAPVRGVGSARRLTEVSSGEVSEAPAEPCPSPSPNPNPNLNPNPKQVPAEPAVDPNPCAYALRCECTHLTDFAGTPCSLTLEAEPRREPPP